MTADEMQQAADREAARDDNEENAQGDEAPKLIKVALGGEIVELPEDQANVIKRAFDTQAGRYGSELESTRRQIQTLQSIGNDRRPTAAEPTRPAPVKIDVPDPDLIFTNKGVWTEQLQRNIETALSGHRQESEALVGAAVEVIQEEMQRREALWNGQLLQRECYREMHGKYPDLKREPAFVQAVYDEIYEDIKHLPMDRAFERLGEVAAQRLAAVGGSNNGNGTQQQQDTTRDARRPGGSPATPRMLSARRTPAGGGAARTPAAPKTLSDRIIERQQRLLGA